MSKNSKARRNKLGLIGWLGGGRYGFERYAYTLHRITGLALLVYFIMHIFVTGARIGGSEAWQTTMERYETPFFKLGEFLVFLAFAFHALNGVRLGLAELGVALGKPQRPVYPYRVSIHRQRPLFIAVMIVAALIMILGGADFYLLGH